jgi:GDP-mannose 6-dehydrogenase
VIGASDKESAAALEGLYGQLDAPLIVTSIANAEMVKYVDNVWHALKVDFANEIGNICKAVGLDSHDVMEIFCRDEKLNLSPYYLRPGFAFGGSCLPKDVRALTYHARSLDVEVPVLNSLIRSNELQIERGIDMVMAAPGKKLGVLGFSFKAGTDDLRESPLVILIERLLGKGYDIRLYDKNVSLARLTGANRAYIENHIPHLARLMVDSVDRVLEHAETIVVGNGAPEFADIHTRTRPDQIVIDLVRVDRAARSGDSYQGICW